MYALACQRYKKKRCKCIPFHHTPSHFKTRPLSLLALSPLPPSNSGHASMHPSISPTPPPPPPLIPILSPRHNQPRLLIIPTNGAQHLREAILLLQPYDRALEGLDQVRHRGAAGRDMRAEFFGRGKGGGERGGGRGGGGGGGGVAGRCWEKKKVVSK